MCGIAGIVSTELNNAVMASKLEVMRNSLRHRGPDGHGDYFAKSGQAVLTHTRLAIIDLTPNGAQPMSSNTERFTITFNGEIYNYQQLRVDLEKKGYRFSSNSDTEVILNLYAEYGARCVNQLRGMFAFVIWDELEKSAFAARDPLGIKPLYFWNDTHSLVFSSELTSILDANVSAQSLDQQALHSYFVSGSVAEPKTLISDISLLSAGQTLTWHSGKIEIRPYWQLTFKSEASITYEQAISTTRQALEDSVRAHLVSDVPVGIFLSGGVDSTALVALASTLSSKQISTYSIAFENPEWNEGDIAQRVATHFGTNHTELVMTPALAQTLFKEYLTTIDQPSIDGFNTFCVSKLAHDHGEKVVLSGLGGDELFAGYKSFSLLPKMRNTSKYLRLIAPLIRFKASLLNHLLSAKIRRAFDFLGQPNSLNAAHQSLRGIFSHTEAMALSALVTQAHPIAFQQIADPEHSTVGDAISEIELSTYLRNQLLRDSDVMSMHWGLELRVPFVDSVLIDTLSKIPAKYRLQQGKTLLTDSIPEIPEWVVNRPKQGFRFPFDEWFASTWQHSKLGLTPPRWIKLTPWYRRWSLVVLSEWINRYAK